MLAIRTLFWRYCPPDAFGSRRFASCPVGRRARRDHASGEPVGAQIGFAARGSVVQRGDPRRASRGAAVARRLAYLDTSAYVKLPLREEIGAFLVYDARLADAEQHLIEAEANSERLPPRHDLRVRLVRHMVELYKKWETADPDGEHSEQAEKWRNLQAEMAIPADGS